MASQLAKTRINEVLTFLHGTGENSKVGEGGLISLRFEEHDSHTPDTPMWIGYADVTPSVTAFGGIRDVYVSRISRSQAVATQDVLTAFIGDGGLFALVFAKYGRAVNDHTEPGLALAKYFTRASMATPSEMAYLSDLRSVCRGAKQRQEETSDGQSDSEMHDELKVYD